MGWKYSRLRVLPGPCHPAMDDSLPVYMHICSEKGAALHKFNRNWGAITFSRAFVLGRGRRGRKHGAVQDLCPERGGLGAFPRAGSDCSHGHMPQEPRGLPAPRPRPSRRPPGSRCLLRPGNSHRPGAFPPGRGELRHQPLWGRVGGRLLSFNINPHQLAPLAPTPRVLPLGGRRGRSVSMEIEGAAVSPSSGHYSRITGSDRFAPNTHQRWTTEGPAGAAGRGDTCPGASPDSHSLRAPAGVPDAGKGGKGKYFSILEILMLACRN